MRFEKSFWPHEVGVRFDLFSSGAIASSEEDDELLCVDHPQILIEMGYAPPPSTHQE
jgi:hypothetical protein